MNTIAILAILYIFMTMGSATILFVSFKDRVDISGRYFFLAELLMIPALISAVLINIGPENENSKFFFPANVFSIISELSIVFAIFCLSREIKITKYLLSVVIAVFYCVFIELARNTINPKLPLLLAAFSSATLALFTYWICRNQLGAELKSNSFLRWFGYLEIGIGLFSLVRLISYFTDQPIVPRNPTPTISLMYALLITLSIFRYISYQSLRISWIDPRTNTPNILNRNLAKSIEEKDQLLRSLMTSNRVLGISALASSLAHQLSQPLTAIALQTETVKRKVSRLIHDRDTTESLSQISNQVIKMSGLVENLRTLFATKDHQFIDVNLQHIINEIVEITEPTLATKNISLVKTYNSSPNIKGNKIQIQQVLINVLNNAIDSLSQSNLSIKQIRLTLSQNKEFAIISIKDSGNGISSEVLPTIFELSKTTKTEGLGVGLWLSKTIVDKHEGHIVAINHPEGGALFDIYIPLINTTRA